MSQMKLIALFVLMVLAGGAGSWGAEADGGDPLGLGELKARGEKLEVSWVVLAGLPNELLGGGVRADGTDAAGLDRDYLKGLDGVGGEAEVVLRDGMVVRYQDDKTGRLWEAKAARMNRKLGEVVNFQDLVTASDRRVGYAYGEIAAKEAGQVYAVFGSDDRAVVWVNGEQVHAFRKHGRSMALGDDAFAFEVKRGVNRVMVKVENGTGDWGFVWDLMTRGEQEAMHRRQQLKVKVERLAGMRVVGLGDEGAYQFHVGDGAFPELGFENETMAAEVLGDYALRVRWFDGEANEVEKPVGVGRYGAVIEVLSDEVSVTRGYPFYGLPDGYEKAGLLGEIDGDYLEMVGIDRAVLTDGEAMMGVEQVWRQEDLVAKQQRRARVLGALHAWGEQRKAGAEWEEWLNTRIMSSDYLLKVKLKADGIEAKPNRRIEGPRVIGADEERGMMVHEGGLSEAGFKEGFKEAIAEVCQTWSDEGGEPFTVMVVRKGVIGYRGAHYPKDSRVIDEKTRFHVASISKLLFSSVLSMARYEGLIDVEDALGLYLKGFAREGEKMMSVRMCMMHSAGTEGHGNYGGMGNLWFEENVKGMLPSLEPGVRVKYNGLSLNLVGRTLEVMGGVSFERYMQKKLYGPLGCVDTDVYDTSFGTNTTARDMAVVGQMLLNGGKYGALKFFDEKTRDEMLPVRRGDVFEKMSEYDDEYGLGSNWYRDVHEDEARTKLRFGKRMFGHGSATSSIFRVDLDHGLVITMARPGGGKDYEEHYQAFFHTIADYME
ncbi:putative periplasmic esterase [Poriferisphaera corsica]|uniref:Putative periplasmic esterase n=1 Tax=Poriferisphaera corsica TaxID=2528020 RepID=A0A517YPC3_9BACT|nr:serine hydrolase domain-containing protein [Poriferisphaera corsica]QDU32052.1 putative periplasmic esterase [Poriferisphaera corsica]